jgi:UDP-2,3-diacylglucosamine pyrophosphatase LpxH
MKSKWLAKLGGKWYDITIRLNRVVNWFLIKMGKKPVRLSKMIKDKVKGLVKKKYDWEEAAANEGIERGYDYVICGHIHKPDIRTVVTDKGSVVYLNSGDWMENMTALEYHDGQWSLYRHDASHATPLPEVVVPQEEYHPSDEQAFAQLILEFGMMESKAS